MGEGKSPIETQEIRLLDAAGSPRLVLSAAGGMPSITLHREDGTVGLAVALDAAGRPSLTLANPVAAAPVAAVEIDDKGAHFKLDHPGGASAYLFLNNAGASGLVLIDTQGRRRLEAEVGVDGTVRVVRSRVPRQRDISSATTPPAPGTR